MCNNEKQNTLVQIINLENLVKIQAKKHLKLLLQTKENLNLE